MSEALAKAIVHTLQSANEEDRNGEVANAVDGLFAIARALDRIASQLERVANDFPDHSTVTDAAGSITAGLHEVANAITGHE